MVSGKWRLILFYFNLKSFVLIIFLINRAVNQTSAIDDDDDDDAIELCSIHIFPIDMS